MKLTTLLICITGVTFLTASCHNKSIESLCKKWDCVKLENLDAFNKTIASPEDSARIMSFENSFKELSWTFKTNKEYLCNTGDKITNQGTYELLDNGKTIVCTSNTKNSYSTYSVIELSGDELVLSSLVNNIPLIMHFRPH